MKNYKIKTGAHSYSRMSVDTVRGEFNESKTHVSNENSNDPNRIIIKGQSSIQEGLQVSEPSIIDDVKNGDLMSRIKNLTQVARSRIAFSKESLGSSEKQPINAFLTHVNVFQSQTKENVPQNKPSQSTFSSDPEAITQELKQFLSNGVSLPAKRLDR